MARKIYKINHKSEYIIEVIFFNGEVREYDVSFLLENNQEHNKDANMLLRMEKYALFAISKSKEEISLGDFGTISADELWCDGVSTGKVFVEDAAVRFANTLIDVREKKNISQRELSRRTGIIQADISKIERAEANPSMAIMQRLVKGLDYELSFEFVRKPDSGRLDVPFSESLAAYLPSTKRQGEFTIGDIEAVPEGMNIELISGVIYEMSAPSLVHQDISAEIGTRFRNFIKTHEGECKALLAPTGVWFEDDNQDFLLPDLLVVCEKKKIRRKGIVGAPDFILEVISPSTGKRDMYEKRRLYEEKGVREYWVMDTDREVLLIYDFENNGIVEMHNLNETVGVKIYNGDLKIDLSELQELMKLPEE